MQEGGIKFFLFTFQTFSHHLKAFSQFLRFMTLSIWISFGGTSPIWWKLWWNFVHLMDWPFTKKSSLQFVFLEMAISLMGKWDMLSLDAKAVAFGKLVLNKAKWSLQSSILSAPHGRQWASLKIQLDIIHWFVWTDLL